MNDKNDVRSPLEPGPEFALGPQTVAATVAAFAQASLARASGGDPARVIRPARAGKAQPERAIRWLMATVSPVGSSPNLGDANGATSGGAPAVATEDELRARLAELERRVARLEPRTVSNRATIVLFSGDMDKAMAALVIATGAATMGMEVSIFCTFWGLTALRRGRKFEGKGVLEKALQLMTPAGISEMNPSRLAFGGAGARIFRKLMRDKGVQSPEELFALARDMGVKLLACQMSMDVMGISEDELIEGIPVAGVAAYLADAADSKVTLFI